MKHLPNSNTSAISYICKSHSGCCDVTVKAWSTHNLKTKALGDHNIPVFKDFPSLFAFPLLVFLLHFRLLRLDIFIQRLQPQDPRIDVSSPYFAWSFHNGSVVVASCPHGEEWCAHFWFRLLCLPANSTLRMTLNSSPCYLSYVNRDCSP
jgi:hypothetical protein